MPKKSEPEHRNRPFRKLRYLLEKKNMPLKSRQTESAAPHVKPADDPTAERQLFEEAMDGVVPLPPDARMRPAAVAKSPPPSPDRSLKGQEIDAVAHLNRLIATGEGFHVADTPEYREGVGPNVPPGITRHLHKGQFSIQDHIDLHGMRSAQAQEALHDFFKRNVAVGRRSMLIVHGRGLSSPDKPVLKTMVHRWLESGPWRHWVMAYSSARACDGGAGATVVLLRQRPLTRRFRKNKPSGQR